MTGKKDFLPFISQCCLTIVLFITSVSVYSQNSSSTPVNLKIAFIGDTSANSKSRAVFNLIKDEGTDAVIHSGDLGYSHGPQKFEDQINEILGEDFPYFMSLGNHDDDDFYTPGGYKELFEARMNRLGIAWDGEYSVKSSLIYQGIFILLTAPDIFDTNHHLYIKEKLASDNSIWRISTWHKNQRLMQVYTKSDETGWEVYEESRRGGAIIATGHAHTYSRTHLMSDIENQIVVSTSSDTLTLAKDLPGTPEDEGKTFVFVSGLGGRNIKDQHLDGSWWASIYTGTQNANYGALFGVFNYGGIPNLAKFYFKDIDGFIPDSFYVTSTLGDTPVPVELKSFQAKATRDQVTLFWETKSETNNLRFNLERAEMSRQFEKIAFVPGRGTSAGPGSYTYEDKNLKPGLYRYRLRQIDLDGNFGYSTIASAQVTPPEHFSLSQNYPNPVRLSNSFSPGSIFSFTIPNRQHINLRVYNLLGQEIITLVSREIDSGYHQINWDLRDRSGKK